MHGEFLVQKERSGAVHRVALPHPFAPRPECMSHILAVVIRSLEENYVLIKKKPPGQLSERSLVLLGTEGLALVLVARESSALVVAVGAGVVVDSEGLALDVLGGRDFGEFGRPVSASLCGASVAEFALGIRHERGPCLLLLAVEGRLPKAGVVLHEFQLFGSVLLVFGRGDVVLVVLCTDKPDNFSLFAFLLRHGGPPRAQRERKRVFSTFLPV